MRIFGVLFTLVRSKKGFAKTEHFFDEGIAFQRLKWYSSSGEK